MENRIGLIYLSDIHFCRGVSGETYDIDEDLRNELLLDAVRLSEQLGSPYGIVISGDIAFAGQTQEYLIAQEWLESLCLAIDCPPENIWTSPGNHDVDRSAIERSEVIQAVHRDLRILDSQEIDDRIRRLMQDPEAGRILYQPLSNYNEFASAFGCDIKPEKPYWETDLILNDGSILRLRGVNSVLVSDRFDNDGDAKLLLGSYSWTVTRQSGVEYFTLCHHPPDWLRDGDDLQNLWNSRAKLQLFGHKHSPRISQVDSTVVLAAGATHPSRREPKWNPSFGRFELFVEGDGDQRELHVDAYVRVWHTDENRFAANFDSEGSDVRSYSLRIDPWANDQHPPSLDESSEGKEGADSDRVAIEDASEVEMSMNPSRRLTYRFLRLPYHVRLRIANELELIEDEDKGLSDSELFQAFFRRASHTDKLESLWQKVAEAGDKPLEDPNPFVGA